MSELRSIVVSVCCVVGFVLFVGGVWAYAIYGVYPSIYSERVYPYRIYGIPFIICGIALLAAGIAVYLNQIEKKDVRKFETLE